MSQTHSLMGSLAFSSISPLFMDRFGRYLRFCHPEFYKKAISDGFLAHSHVFRRGRVEYSVVLVDLVFIVVLKINKTILTFLKKRPKLSVINSLTE